VTILGRGTGLVGGTIKSKLTRESLGAESSATVFFPKVGPDEMPLARKAGRPAGGLAFPTQADAAITRHLARFLRLEANAQTHATSCFKRWRSLRR